jgi:hypothetical protein
MRLNKQARNQETLELEKKIKETVKDRSLYEDESEVRIKSTRGFGRARSPLINDKTISETVMYGGGTSVIDSIMGSFPQEQNSILNSQEFERRHCRNISGDYIGAIQDTSHEDSRNIIHKTVSESKNNSTCYSKNFARISKNFEFSKDFHLGLGDINKRMMEDHCWENKTERKQCVNTSISPMHENFLPKKNEQLEKNKSCLVLPIKGIPKTAEIIKDNKFKKLGNVECNSIWPSLAQSRSNMRHSCRTHNEDSKYLKYMGRNLNRDHSNERNLPYQDTFDNGGMDVNEPLASARYRNSENNNDRSETTEKNEREPITRKVRHHRNISHASFPSDDSDTEQGEFGIWFVDKTKKALMKHSQSVLQFKDKNKAGKKAILRYGMLNWLF